MLAQPASDTDRQPAMVWHWSSLVSCPSFSHSFAQQRCLPFVPPPPPLYSAFSPLHAFHYGPLRSANTTREHNLRVEIMPPPRRRTKKRGKGGGEPASAGQVAGRTATVAAMWVVITNNQPTRLRGRWTDRGTAGPACLPACGRRDRRARAVRSRQKGCLTYFVFVFLQSI